ncbi:MAG: 30S ribosomal protein S11, partial [Candidatus Riflebacteria bacterium]|nr:30S ribosomal protein S11 [Candidatus Riflebacteria bacterium]
AVMTRAGAAASAAAVDRTGPQPISRHRRTGRNAISDRVRSGPGAGKDSAVRCIQGSKVKVGLIKDVTSAPHNGCRPKKRRRV